MQTTSRREAFSQFCKQPFDLLVVGGGITGAGIARDAALRGLCVGLLEKGDVGSGTSSKSSKLIHGGLRYLQQAEFGLVFESVSERTLLFKLAPHLVRPQRFLVPTYKGHFPGRFVLGCGMWMYDALSKFSAPDRHRGFRKKAVYTLEPCLRTEGLTGGVTYYDGITDDARLTLETLLDAQAAGAKVLSYARVDRFVEDKEGTILGVCVSDVLDPNHTAEAFAKITVNATGPWTDGVLGKLRHAQPGPLLRPTKGVHVVIDHARLPISHAIVMTVPSDGRIIFAIPWLDSESKEAGRTILGTTDTDFSGEPDEVFADAADVAYLLDVANQYFPECTLVAQDVLATWAGLRPLVAPDGDGLDASSVSREHRIVSSPGLVSIMGGKLTTYRRMAAELVSEVYAQLGESEPACPTETRPLPGACDWMSQPEGVDPLATLAQELHKLAVPGLDPQVAFHFSTTYGMRSRSLVEDLQRKLASGDVQAKERLDPEQPFLFVEVDQAVTQDLALRLDDVLSRRLPLLLVGRDQGLSVAPAVASRMAALLGWEKDREASELSSYQQVVARSRRFRMA